MKLHQKTVAFIITLITIALVGLGGIQVYLLNHAMKLEAQIFDQNVNLAMSSILQKLETRETLQSVFTVGFDEDDPIDDETEIETGLEDIDEDMEIDPAPEDIAEWSENDQKTFDVDISVDRRIGAYVDGCTDISDVFVIPRRKDEVLTFNDEPDIALFADRLAFHLPEPQHVEVLMLDSLGQKINRLMDDVKPAGEHEIQISPQMRGGKFQLNFSTDSTSYVLNIVDGNTGKIIKNPLKGKNRRILVEKVLNDMTSTKPVSIAKRIHPDILDSIIGETLREHGITIPYNYTVVNTKSDSVILTRMAIPAKSISGGGYRTRIFPHDLFAGNQELVLTFPSKKVFLMRRLGLMAGTGFLFISVIIFCFAYVVRTIYRQKSFSQRLIDFINNMTHEFKTPISTIGLASEAITNPRVRADSKKLTRYSGIISDESGRMRRQVEKILQMAALEEGELELNLTRVNMHELIHRAVANFTLKTDRNNGKITTHLNAELDIVKGDAVHLENVIHNLLDNAMKYVQETPKIEIATENADGFLKCLFRDNGVGLSPEHQKRIFDKYYRVPTGNVHDVKGFGLGLSYVKIIVEAHDGKISVQSELNEGSAFEILLPLSCGDHSSQSAK